MKCKCPDSYCVPWACVYGGKWDCPQDYDNLPIVGVVKMHPCGKMDVIVAWIVLLEMMSLYVSNIFPRYLQVTTCHFFYITMETDDCCLPYWHNFKKQKVHH